jgi:hypothetical protein
MGSKEFDKRLAAMDQTWKAGKERKDEPFELKIETGRYRAALTDLELLRSQSSDKLIIKREWAVLEGDHADDIFCDFLSIENEWGLLATHRFIETMGYAVPDSASDLPDLLDEILKQKPECMIKVKVKDDFANVRVLEILNAAPTEEQTAGAEEVPAADAGEAPAEEVPAEEPEVTPAPKVKTAKTLLENLKDLCDANDVKYDKKKDNEKTLTVLVKKKVWAKGEMTDSELATLKKIGAKIK